MASGNDGDRDGSQRTTLKPLECQREGIARRKSQGGLCQKVYAVAKKNRFKLGLGHGGVRYCCRRVETAKR